MVIWEEAWVNSRKIIVIVEPETCKLSGVRIKGDMIIISFMIMHYCFCSFLYCGARLGIILIIVVFVPMILYMLYKKIIAYCLTKKL